MNRTEQGWIGALGPHPAPGDTVGRYRLGAQIGAGGTATVFTATDERGAPVALKVLNPARVLAEDVKRFAREYKALCRMDHENIVKVYEAGVHEGYPWIAMELVDGHDLDTEIERWKETDPKDRWTRVHRILVGLCKGLAYVHDLGLVHRDLKPGNVLLTRAGEPKISDFGVVKGGESTHATQLTMAGRLVGTVAFMAPEIITDEGVDRRADLYALGAVLYLMCTYRRPIEADSVAGYLARHLTEVPRPMGEIDPSTPPVLERVAARLLQKDRAYRYPSASAVLQALERPDDPEVPPLRGRDPIQTRWTRTLLALQEGAGGAAVLVGPDGAGKTHLLRSLVEQVHAQGLRVAFASGAAHTAAGLVAALGGRAPPGREWEELDRLVDAEPVVLAVDDLDQAPPAVIQGLSRLLRQRVAIDGEPVLLLFTTRETEGDLQPLVDGGSTGVPCDVVDVGALDPKSVLALLRDRGITGPVAPVLARRLHADYGGMPGPMVRQVEALVDHGWLAARGSTSEVLEPRRPLDDFRRAELPVPRVVRGRILAELEELDPASRELCELLAVLDRPASGALLERCRANDPDTPRLLDWLVQQRILGRTEVEAHEVLVLADPCAPRVIRGSLEPKHARRLHAAVADALGARKRRANNALEVAHHLRRAGDEAAAWPLYIQAARRAAREGRFGEVLDVCDAADEVRAQGESAVEPQERARLLRWINLLRGEALLARRAWDEAVSPLEAAAEAARQEGDRASIGRALGSLGRAHYRGARFDEAEPLLRDALGLAEPGAPERASALRALADIALRRGRLPEAERLWDEALAAAQAMGSKDAEARARRGLAHLRAIEGRLDRSAALLAQADDLLAPDGDFRVRAGVLARAVELDTASGRLGSALYRAELLVDLARRHGMGERLPEAYALLGELLVRLGDAGEAEDAAHQSLVFARATEGTGWEPRVRAARVLLDLDKPEEAQAALPGPEDLVQSTLHDAPAQLAALRARLHAVEQPARARDLALWALTRSPPLFVLAGSRIALDVALALAALGQTQASRSAVKRGLKLLGSGGDGLRLELLVAMHTVAPDPRVLDAITQVAGRIVPLLPPNMVEPFRCRPILAEALR